MDVQMIKQELDMAMLNTTRNATAGLVTSTVDRLNSGRIGMTPVVDATYDMQKSVLSAAYAEKGIGTSLDMFA